MALDRIDRKIVMEIQRDGRISNQALADRIGLSPSPCLQRFRRLEKDGVIGPFYAQVDLDRLCPNVMVLTTVSLDTAGHEDYRAFETLVAGIPEIIQCFKVSGDFDYLLWFVCRSVADYHRISEKQIEDGPAKVRIASHVVLDRTKDFKGMPLESLLAGAS
ncbi:MAG: Lrp/AsnC family transcriptional regulator [Alphaproteobacteria bacterium]|jgi:DNA-binding Lrp family transcriptional regulator|uniref:Lrp/AsnC family transcriptional regulator n=1 Tax=Pacificispira sp. TaxID=2888761 RepID=UPI001B195D6F|nr:Lrp/AsnC family transcriptional regulator [Alphaproteobacteria bacterium]MBO6864436.1 Lrp/AsnC family transcriptional regulator [Alphaproteobacteria bacterium]MEC9266648.1 Lrp/AsnC family transcriptional regulator [Pseudomonadota bacterium]